MGRSPGEVTLKNTGENDRSHFWMAGRCVARQSSNTRFESSSKLAWILTWTFRSVIQVSGHQSPWFWWYSKIRIWNVRLALLTLKSFNIFCRMYRHGCLMLKHQPITTKHSAKSFLLKAFQCQQRRPQVSIEDGFQLCALDRCDRLQQNTQERQQRPTTLLIANYNDKGVFYLTPVSVLQTVYIVSELRAKQFCVKLRYINR